MKFEKIIDGISNISEYIWQRGWSERNAGNISVNLSNLNEGFETLPGKIPLSDCYGNLGGKYFLITVAGSRMRDIHHNPLENIMVIKISDDGKSYSKTVYGGKNREKEEPTSELATHLAVHSLIMEKGGNERVVLHAHVTELIALTQIKEFCDEERLNMLLWSMHPETVMFVPGGVGFVTYTTPGTGAIARKTVKALQKHKVALWEKHGVFAIGETVQETFDIIDILAKSAKIFFQVKSAGYSPEGINAREIEVLKASNREVR